MGLLSLFLSLDHKFLLVATRAACIGKIQEYGAASQYRARSDVFSLQAVDFLPFSDIPLD